MRMKPAICAALWGLSLAFLTSSAFGQLYSQNFDADDTANWTVNGSTVTDYFADFFFDYSSIGIPSAPNSTGGSTRGLKMQANLINGVFGGFSVSPTGQSFTGDYVLSYDMWQSYQGVTFVPASSGGPSGGIRQGQSSGTTNLAYGGIMTSGTYSNSAGFSDSVFFAATPDGDSASDYRAYSSDKVVSYNTPNLLPSIDTAYNAADNAATYFATGTGSLKSDFNTSNWVDGADFLTWQKNFGYTETDPLVTSIKSKGDANADKTVNGTDLVYWDFYYAKPFRTQNSTGSTLYTDNFGGEQPTAAQAADPRWSTQLVIDPDNKTGAGSMAYAWRHHTITKLGNIVTWAIDGINIVQVDTTNFTIPTSGTNILFGYGDTNNGKSANPEAFDLLCAIVDNVRVDSLSPLVGTSAVPEPSTLVTLLGGLAFALCGRRRR